MNDFAETLNASLIALFRDKQEVSHKALRVEKFYESTYEISCHMGFYDAEGKAAGVALLDIDGSNLTEMWSNVLGLPVDGAEPSEIATELVNMIVGNASALFFEKGRKIDIALPQIIDCGHQIKLSTFQRDDFHYFEFAGPRLRFNWVVCLYDVIRF